MLLASACLKAGADKSGFVRPAPLGDVEEALLGNKENTSLFQRLLEKISISDSTSEDPKYPSPSFRAHLFFRQIKGFWACSNPECTEVHEEFSFEGRTIESYIKTPLIKCKCGSQVLEMTYCYDCGEPYLGALW